MKNKKLSIFLDRIIRELKRNGSPMPEFETDVDRTYLITAIKIHENSAQK